MSGHDWRNWATCQCREPGCRSYRAAATRRLEDLEVDVANWKRRAEEAQELLTHGAATWEATIRDRDEQKARADAVEAKLAKVRDRVNGHNASIHGIRVDILTIIAGGE